MSPASHGAYVRLNAARRGPFDRPWRRRSCRRSIVSCRPKRPCRRRRASRRCCTGRCLRLLRPCGTGRVPWRTSDRRWGTRHVWPRCRCRCRAGARRRGHRAVQLEAVHAMCDAVILPGHVVEALGDDARVGAGCLGRRGGGGGLEREHRALLAGREVVREHQVVIGGAPVIVLVVSDLRRQRAALRITHDDVVHAQVRARPRDFRERNGDDGRGPRGIERMRHGDGHTGSASAPPRQHRQHGGEATRQIPFAMANPRRAQIFPLFAPKITESRMTGRHGPERRLGIADGIEQQRAVGARHGKGVEPGVIVGHAPEGDGRDAAAD